jgi:hypothetical protein
MRPPAVRTCNLCEAQKAIEEFRRTKHKQYEGYKHTCLSCESIKNKVRNAEYYAKNRDKALAKAKEKYQPRERKPRKPRKTKVRTAVELAPFVPVPEIPQPELQPEGIQLYENYTEPVVMEVQLC